MVIHWEMYKEVKERESWVDAPDVLNTTGYVCLEYFA